MAFNEQVKDTTTTGFKSTTFQPHVKFKMLDAKSALVFRILPAFNKEDIVEDPNTKHKIINPMSYVPFRTPDGSLTDWGFITYLNRFVGHGSYKDGTRRDFVAVKTFENESDNIFDPYVELQRRASADPDWSYLTKDIKDPTNNQFIEGAALPKTQNYLLLNIVDLNEPDSVKIGMFSSSASKSLLGKDAGIAATRASNVTDAQIQENYLMEWAVGDLTDPTSGPVLLAAKGTDRGEMSGYYMTLKLDAVSHVQRWPLNPPSLLGMRYDLSNPRSILLEMSPEETIKEFVKLFNARSPKGYHEWALLKEVFGGVYGNLIPDPPAAKTAVSSGFGSPPVASTAPGTPAAPTAAPIAAPTAPVSPTAAPTAPDTPAAPYTTNSSPAAAPDTASAAFVAEVPPNIPGMVNKPFSASDFYKRNS